MNDATDARLARAFVRSRQRRPVSLLDRYVSVFMLAIAVAVFGNPVTTAVTGLAGQVDAARMGPGVALVMLALAGFLALGRAAGPVVLPAADASWLLLSGVGRRGLLGRPVRILAVITLAAGALLGLALLTALGAPDQLVWRLLAAVVLGMSASAGGMALAVLGQGSQAWQTWSTVALVAVLAVAVAAAIGPAREPLAAVAAAPAQALGAAAAGALAAAALLVRHAWTALDRIPAGTLMGAATRARHLTTAATQLDPGALTWAAEDDHWRGRRLRSRRWPSLPAPLALAWQDWRRVARRPGRLALMAATTTLPALLTQATGTAPTNLGRGSATESLTGMPDAGSLASAGGGQSAENLAGIAGGPTAENLTGIASGAVAGGGGPMEGVGALVGGLAPAALLIGGALAVAASAVAGARRDADNPALARLAAVGTRAALLARALLPALLAAAWMAAALGWLAAAGAVAGPWWAFGPLAAPALAAGALRMARRPPVDHSLPLIDTPAGAIPTGPVFWAATGPDLALLGCLPTLAALVAQPADPSGHLAAQAVTGLGALAAYAYRQKAR
ncbi:DUF6297 family protein [Nonomuraea harbinensis]|uniref:DUF6297 family protein n=1 Tax=Nonomuraea harbinensis TaxID=1286938 RepID=UPI001C5DCBCC|nr:DUF6297 family protein [Nonomuraea harbinensis]